MTCPECGAVLPAASEDAAEAVAEVQAEAQVASAEAYAAAEVASTESRETMNADDNDASTERAEIDAEARVAEAEIHADAAVQIAEAQAEADVAAVALLADALSEPEGTPEGDEPPPAAEAGSVDDAAVSGEPASTPVSIPPQLRDDAAPAAGAGRPVRISKFRARATRAR